MICPAGECCAAACGIAPGIGSTAASTRQGIGVPSSIGKSAVIRPLAEDSSRPGGWDAADIIATPVCESESRPCAALCTAGGLAVVECRVHLVGADDELVSVRPLLELISDRDRFIGEPDAPDIADVLHAHAGTGRPLGPDSFVKALELRLGRPLERQKPGPKPPRRDSHTLDIFELLERD